MLNVMLNLQGQNKVITMLYDSKVGYDRSYPQQITLRLIQDPTNAGFLSTRYQSHAELEIQNLLSNVR